MVEWMDTQEYQFIWKPLTITKQALYTVLTCFQEANSEFGLPTRVPSDKGGENVEVATFMLNHVKRGLAEEVWSQIQ